MWAVGLFTSPILGLVWLQRWWEQIIIFSKDGKAPGLAWARTQLYEEWVTLYKLPTGNISVPASFCCHLLWPVGRWGCRCPEFVEFKLELRKYSFGWVSWEKLHWRPFGCGAEGCAGLGWMKKKGPFYSWNMSPGDCSVKSEWINEISQINEKLLV